ncbi:hypothetical protein N7582_002654 [Saccharomyces uvarum]|uniref:Zn(2)-C6 fungal-type domain-containing protein n=1 Tax=Saccharomyces uvarum TaxID=230603 RepID=A0AA35NTZ9_SACUV|nr:hypothetical protein N7582_002654 [Saccharomyces uvarum]CAI4064259.1 hypothetical protein SUVC_08G1990 [Saccharomyces uvarum]
MKRTSDALSETFQVADVTPPSDNSNGTGGGSGGGGGGSNATRPTSSNSNKKRNKLIKSCGFCRRRKLRCDQQKPMCSTCISRNLVACQYAEEFNKSVEKKAIYGTFSNMELLKKIDDLENKIQLLENDRNTNPPTNFMYSSSNFPLLNATACGESTETSSPLSDGVINPYADRHYVQYKHSGRSIIYGPTSMRTQIFNTNWGFMSKYKQLWAKIKVERNIWKKNNQKTMCRELGLLKESSWEPGSLLKQICKFLPTYEKIFSIIDHIFDDELINEFNIILDKTKIRKDFMDYFMPGKDLLPNGERPIVYILSNSKNNYYKAAVILMILCLRHFYGNIPEPLERFLIFLNGTTTEKIFYIERAQMLILIFYHRELHSFGGDGSRMLNLNESLFATVTTVGLHLDIRKVFKGEEKSMGSMESLENVWFMAILIDYSMSAHIGKPLLITKYYLDERQEYCVLNDQSKTYEGKMKRYLKLARSMLFALYDREKFPDLKLFSRQLISFVEEELAPLKDFTDETLAVEVPLRETRILCMALGLILSFYALVHSVLKVRNFEAKNNTFQLVLVNFSVIVNTTIRCFLIDKERFPECFEPSYPHLPPTLAMSMSLRGGLFSKTLVFFCSLVFFKLTLFENGICLSNDMECGWSDLSSITVPLDKDLSMGTAMKLYTSISDRLVKAGDKLLIRTLQNSPEFLIELAVEKTSRTILGNVLEFRRMTEETWLSQIKQELDPQNHQLPTELRSEQEQQQEQQQQQQQQQHHHHQQHHVPLNRETSLPQDPGSPSLPSGPSMVPPTATTQSGDKSPTKSQSEIIQMLTDEFWTNYNLGWEELINQSEFSTLFNDFDGSTAKPRGR